MTKKIIVVNFDIESKSYQAFSEIKKMHLAKEIKGEQLAVVTHKEDGTHQFEINDFIDFTGNNHSAKDSTIGMFVGLLGGPLGMMLGWFAGSMIGGAKDVNEVKEATSIFEFVAKQIDEGQTGALLIAEEEDNRPLNELIFNHLGGHITRLDYAEVEQELAEAQKLEKEVKEKETDNN
ncbi:DUF1269 domain-containing protein [Vagococcus intermedius]|uniref:DUF1269 domain-containing protein n=1 Tax=Vagococcus intermedius TaxID=2991418 RepID=A0AAF0CTG7_9ENTE|nr:DUF1269 domain-containing protein [Vagococcus intermedius]WEG72650.1 DUF1269 domain-containing protein [Vagococcus intermedius]WEG74735.1 DUF1269 domain-containing protein [Vagococcus intermedius]